MPRKPRIDPQIWQPPPLPARALRSSGDQPVRSLSLLPLGGAGPEDVVVDADGWLLTGLDNGQILKVNPTTGVVSVLANTGGRPLGLEILPDSRILICDSDHGLLRLDPADGTITRLVTEVNGVPLRFCSNAVAAKDGTIYFTESTTRFGFEHWKAAILEHSGTGRLLRLTVDGDVGVLLDGLQFANGLVLDPDGSSLVVAETGAYRLTRYWLQGPQAGSSQVLVDNLPGFPDNLSVGSEGIIWTAIANPRDRLLDRLHRAHPLWRRLVWALPDGLSPDVTPTVWAMAVDFDGRIVRDLQTTDERYGMVTGLVEHADRLYLASLKHDALAVVDLRSL